jgi:hypothetical protein
MPPAGGSLVARGFVSIRADLSGLRSDLRSATSMVAQAFATMTGTATGMLAAAGIQVGMRSIVELSKEIVGGFISVNDQFQQYETSATMLSPI